MKKAYQKLLAVIFCIVLLSGSITAQDSALREEFQKMNNEMITMMLENPGNVDALMSRYTDDCISMPSYEPMLKGKEAMLESHKRDQEAGFKINDMTLTTMDVWTSGDYAYEVGTYTIDISMPGMDNWKDNGKYITIWQKQSDGSWKIKTETWNTDNNPWMDMEMSHDDDMNDE